MTITKVTNNWHNRRLFFLISYLSEAKVTTPITFRNKVVVYSLVFGMRLIIPMREKKEKNKNYEREKKYFFTITSFV